MYYLYTHSQIPSKKESKKKNNKIIIQHYFNPKPFKKFSNDRRQIQNLWLILGTKDKDYLSDFETKMIVKIFSNRGESLRGENGFDFELLSDLVQVFRV